MLKMVYVEVLSMCLVDYLIVYFFKIAEVGKIIGEWN